MRLPIDDLRDGSLTDDAVLHLAAATIRASVESNYSPESRATYLAMARRLELVRLIEPRQTRARAVYWPESA